MSHIRQLYILIHFISRLLFVKFWKLGIHCLNYRENIVISSIVFKILIITSYHYTSYSYRQKSWSFLMSLNVHIFYKQMGSMTHSIRQLAYNKRINFQKRFRSKTYLRSFCFKKKLPLRMWLHYLFQLIK